MTQGVALTPKRTTRFPLVLAAATLTGVEGVLSLIVAQRSLSVVDFAPLGQLWTIWAVTAASLTYAFQQWSASFEVRARDLVVGNAAHVRTIVLATSAVVLVVAVTFSRRLFVSEAMWWPVFAAVIPIGTTATGWKRGQLARSGERARLALVIAGENAIRLVGTIALVAVGASNLWFGVVLLCGFLIALTPSRGPRAHGEMATPPPPSGPLVTAAVVGLCSHAFLFGAPLVLALSGGSADAVALMFLVLTSVRAPFILLQGVIPQLAASLAGHPDDHRRRRLVLLIGLACTIGAVLAAVAGVLLGDPIVGRVFDILGEVDPAVYGLIAASSVLSAALLVATVVLVAEQRPRPLGIAWSIPVAGTVLAMWFGLVDTLPAMATWLLLGHGIMAVLILSAMWSTQAP